MLDMNADSLIPEIPAKLAQLVERFDQHLDTYTGPHYNEAQLRQEFVDPFFRILGWDWPSPDLTDIREVGHGPGEDVPHGKQTATSETIVHAGVQG